MSPAIWSVPVEDVGSGNLVDEKGAIAMTALVETFLILV
jgi:hypothetical protein